MPPLARPADRSHHRGAWRVTLSARARLSHPIRSRRGPLPGRQLAAVARGPDRVVAVTADVTVGLGLGLRLLDGDVRGSERSKPRDEHRTTAVLILTG